LGQLKTEQKSKLGPNKLNFQEQFRIDRSSRARLEKWEKKIFFTGSAALRFELRRA
jgi:hypothetical protein